MHVIKKKLRSVSEERKHLAREPKSIRPIFSSHLVLLVINIEVLKVNTDVFRKTHRHTHKSDKTQKFFFDQSTICLPVHNNNNQAALNI